MEQLHNRLIFLHIFGLNETSIGIFCTMTVIDSAPVLLSQLYAQLHPGSEATNTHLHTNSCTMI
jgi:hypothetical protein